MLPVFVKHRILSFMSY